MDQTIINTLFGAVGVLMGAIIKTLWDSVKDLQKSDKEITEKVHSLETNVVGDYVKEAKFDKKMDAIFQKLDQIEERINNKTKTNE